MIQRILKSQAIVQFILFLCTYLDRNRFKIRIDHDDFKGILSLTDYIERLAQ